MLSQPVRALMREAGAAFAVLASYVLTLLTPLHQAAASQRGFAELGYETVGVWSICTATAEARSDSEIPAAVKCPVTGTGKQDLAPAPLPVTPQVRLDVADVVFARFAQAPPSSALHPGAHPRAPPALA